MVSPHKSNEDKVHPEHGRQERKDGRNPNNGGQGHEHQPDSVLKQQLEKEKASASELKDVLQRVQAEFENYIKRSEREQRSFQETANAKLMQEFLPVLDSFDAAIEKMGKLPDSRERREAVEGMQILRKQFWSAMERNGAREMKSVGEKFDPEKHECFVFENAKDKDDEVVLEEIQKGYFMKDRIIRHAKVRVNKRS